MNRKKLVDLKSDLMRMRANFAPIESRLLEKYARAVGRERDPRGKEPNWVRKIDPELTPPLSIPNHAKPLKAGTARSIIDQLISDVDEWLLYLGQHEDDK